MHREQIKGSEGFRGCLTCSSGYKATAVWAFFVKVGLKQPPHNSPPQKSPAKPLVPDMASTRQTPSYSQVRSCPSGPRGPIRSGPLSFPAFIPTFRVPVNVPLAGPCMPPALVYHASLAWGCATPDAIAWHCFFCPWDIPPMFLVPLRSGFHGDGRGLGWKRRRRLDLIKHPCLPSPSAAGFRTLPLLRLIHAPCEGLSVLVEAGNDSGDGSGDEEG